MKISEIKFAEKKFKFIYTDKISEFPGLIKKLMNRPADYIFGVDIETAALPKFKSNKEAALSSLTSQPRLLQIATEDSVVVFDLIGPHSELNAKPLRLFTEFLETRIWTAHFGVFELSFFLKYAIKKLPDAHCSLLMAKLLLHASRPIDNQQLSLEALCLSEFRVHLAKGNQVSDWSKPLTWEQLSYAALDAIGTRELYYYLLPKLKEKKLGKIYSLVKRTQWPIVKMQLEGISVDEKAYAKHIVKWAKELVKARNVLIEQHGFKKITSSTIANWLKNNLDPASLLIWPKTDGTKDKEPELQKLKTDAHAFTEFGHLKVVEPISNYQKYDKLLSTYGQKLLDARSDADGKLHTSFKLIGARTGRLSSANPNFQNFPRDKDIRSAFIPDSPELCFVVADYSQIEVRVAAEYSRDEQLLNVYRKGLDVYKVTVAGVTGKPISAITDDERQLGKALLLGMLYGLGAKKFGHYAKKGYGVELSDDSAYTFVQAFKNLYSGYYDWQQQQAKNAQQEPYIVTTALGKRRKLDRKNTYGTSMNHPIQGTSAEIMMLALCMVQSAIDKGAKCRLVSNIHDEIILVCKRQDSLDIAELLRDNMIKAFSYIFPKGIIRNLVEVGIGDSWAAAKDKKNKVAFTSAH